METTNKMQWFIDKYNSNKLDYKIANTHANFGTVVMPTGYGKSSVVYEDILHTIDTIDATKVIFNISCPILKLTQQFISDLFSILREIDNDKINGIRFYINSSDNGNNYSDALRSIGDGIDANSFSNIDKFFNDNDARFAIVASCHKSLAKFINKSAKFNDNTAFVINYIDEAHLIDLHTNLDEDDVVAIDVDKMCRYSIKTYAFTATPNEDVTKAINKYNINSQQNYIIHVRPIEAIKENIIVAPLVKFIPIGENDHISEKALIAIMKNAIVENPNINHKILVTLKASEDLKELRESLEKLNYKVFSTCAKYGFGTKEEIKNEDDINKFINDVDSYDGHCFVLHIRQLIQGIDIKSLTDCVLLNTSHGNQKHYRHTIQTIGRILRPYTGERGINKDLRKKKVGRVYFLVPDSAEEARSNIEQFVFRYYGFDNVTFESYSYSEAGIHQNDLFDNLPHNYTGNDNSAIIELLCNIEKYIDSQIAPKIKFELKHKAKRKKSIIEAEAKQILAKFDAFGKEYNSVELLDNTDLLNKILKMFNKYDIQNQLF